jgi:CheY-like chemotaxis protein
MVGTNRFVPVPAFVASMLFACLDVLGASSIMRVGAGFGDRVVVMPLSTVHLVVIDDDDVDVESVVRSLNRNGIFGEITVFRDGLDALRALQQESARPSSRPLLILLDLDLPRLNGLEFLDALRSDPRLCGTTVFVLTLSDRLEDKLAAYDRQVAGYMLKSKLGENFALLPKLLRSYCRLVAPQVFPSDVQPSPL